MQIRPVVLLSDYTPKSFNSRPNVSATARLVTRSACMLMADAIPGSLNCTRLMKSNEVRMLLTATRCHFAESITFTINRDFPDRIFGGTDEVPSSYFMAMVTGVAIHCDIFRPFSDYSVSHKRSFFTKIRTPRRRCSPDGLMEGKPTR